MPFSELEFKKNYRLWTIWQAVDRKPTEFLAASKMPIALLDLFMQIDTVFDKMQQQKSKGKNVLPFGALISKLKGKKKDI